MVEFYRLRKFLKKFFNGIICLVAVVCSNKAGNLEILT